MGVSTIVQELYKRGVLIEPDALEYLNENSEELSSTLAGLDQTVSVLTLPLLKELASSRGPVSDDELRIIFSYDESFELKGGVQDFHSYFSDRHQKLSSYLRGRPELKNVISANRLNNVGNNDAALIGLVSEVSETKAGHYLVELEDQTGTVKIIFPKGSEGHKKASEIVYDEVIGVSGRSNRELVFGKNLVFPEIPPTEWPKQNLSVVLISDTHVGSNKFMESAFMNFISWLKGEWGTPEQVELAKTVKHVLIAGDLVDGCGVYKGQINELVYPDIQQQYEHFTQLISNIPKHIRVVISPGNHDATREAEPQPPIPEQFAASLHKLGNVSLVSNPAYVMVGGLVVLMYHGVGLDSIINSLPWLRKVGYDQPHKAMELLLRKRHLCPIYSESTHIFPETQDHLVISKIPNVLHMGHVHSVGASIYRGVRLINSGTFQSQTPFQAKIGHHPTPGIVPVVTGDGKIIFINFLENHEGLPESPAPAASTPTTTES